MSWTKRGLDLGSCWHIEPKLLKIQVSNEQKLLSCLGYILNSYMGTTINHYKDRHSKTSIVESEKVFFVPVELFHPFF